MTVYVDNARIPMGAYLMSHMIADSSEELREMARRIGVAERHIQHEGTTAEHFDISDSKRMGAIRLGARSITSRQLVRILRERAREEPGEGA